MISFIFSFPLLLSFTNSKIQFGPRLSTQVQKNPYMQLKNSSKITPLPELSNLDSKTRKFSKVVRNTTDEKQLSPPIDAL